MKGKQSKQKKGSKKPAKRITVKKNVDDFASLSCTNSLGFNNALPVVNQMYGITNISLEQFDRAVQVARGFQHYRIKYVQLRFRPTYDTFSANAGNSKMNLYYMIDKSGSIPTGVTLEGLKQMGAKPRALDEKPITVGWSPSVLTTDMQQGGPAGAVQSSQYKISPWLATSLVPVNNVWNPNSIDHLGIYFMVEQAFANAVTSYELEIEVQFEFKKPLWTAVAQAESAIVPVAFTKDGSKDGILNHKD